MANTRFQHKRSTVSGVSPTTSDITTAELAINVADRKLFTSNGTSVFELGSNLVNLSVTGNAAINAIIANGSLGSAGQLLNSNGTAIYWSDDRSANAYTNAVAYVDGKSYVNTSQLSSNLANYQTTAGLASNVATLTANNTSFVGSISAANVVSNAQLSSNLANYQTTAGLSANVATLSSNSATYLGNSSGTIANIASWITGNSGTAYTNAVNYVDGKSYVNTSQLSSNLANYQTTAGLSANVATLSSNSATYLGSSITFGNSTGIYTTGTINAASLTVGTSVIANSSRLAIGTAVGLQANGGIGAAGEVLHSNGTTIYWAADDQGVTSVSTGNGLNGGPITTTGTVSVLANNGITANSTGLFVFGNTGLVVNATGVHVNATYIGTLAANSATYLGSVNNLGNATGIYTTGTINAASLTVGSSTIANSTGVYTGVVNGSSLTVGSSIIANTTRLVIGTAVGLQANGGIGASGQVLTSNATTVYWSTPTTGSVTSVSTGNGLTGGPISTTGTISVLANNGIIANSTGLFVFANTGLIANATGVHVNTTYVATQSGVETLSSKTLKNQSIQYFNSGTTSALDYTNGSHQRWAPTGTVSLTISNWPASGVLGELLIEGINLGAATITWPTINWIKSDGTTTTTFAGNGVTLQSSGTDWVFLWTRDGGTTVYGKIVR